MVSNFVLPITPSAAVTHAFSTHMTDQTRNEMVLVRCGFLQMHLFNETEGEFQCFQSVKLRGNVKDACVFRPPRSRRDVILVVTNETTLTAYGFKYGKLAIEGCGTVGNILECGTEIFSHQGNFVIGHSSGVIVVRVRAQSFTIILWDDLKKNQTYSILPTRDIYSTNSIIKQMVFLNTEEDNNRLEIAYIVEEEYGRHLQFFELDLKRNSLDRIGPDIPLLDDVICLAPLAQPYGGVIVKMTDRFIQFKIDGTRHETVIHNKKFMTVICFAQMAEKGRLIFCDYLGTLYSLLLWHDEDNGRFYMRATPAGSVKAAYTMCFINDKFLFFGTKYNDSVMAHYAKDRGEGSVREFQTFPHLGGISHLSIVDDGKFRMLMGLNTNDEPSLRLSKRVNQFRIHYTIDENPQNAMFAFGHHSCLKNHIISTFGRKSVLMEIGMTDRIPSFSEHIDTENATLAAGTFLPSQCCYQITTQEIRIFNQTQGLVTWMPGKHIDLASVNRDTNQILVSCRNHVYYLIFQSERFKILLRRSNDFTGEITCIDLPHDKSSSRVFAVGFWSTKECSVYRLNSFERVANYKLHESFPRSIALNCYHEKYYVFCGTADGRLLNATVNFRTSNFDDVLETNLGYQPVLFVRPDVNDPQNIYALSDRTIAIDDKNECVNFVEYDLSQLTALCYLKTNKKREYAIASSYVGTQIGYMDDSPSFKVRDFQINHHPYDMCYSDELKKVGLLCRRKNYVKRRVIVNPDVEEEIESYDAVNPTDEPDFNEIKTYFVTLHGENFNQQEEIEFREHEYASAITSGKFASDPRTCFIAAALQFTRESGQSYNAIKHSIDRDREKWLTNRILFTFYDTKDHKKKKTISASLGHGMIQHIGILGDTLIAALRTKIVAFKFEMGEPMPLTSVAEIRADDPLVMKIRNDQILITELRRAYVLVYSEKKKCFKMITRDDRCHRISAAEFITDDFLIGADQYNEIIWGHTGIDGVYSTRAFGQRKSCYVRERIGAFAIGNLHTERPYCLNKLRNPVMYTTWRGGIGVIAEVSTVTLKLLRDLIEMLAITKTPYVALERSNTGMFMTNRFLEGNFLRTFLNWQEDQLMEILEKHKVSKNRLPNCLRLIQDVKKLVKDMETYY
ncbi:unnamed protein product [Auanema sp. JU1783]|nr:unnamed protein product [Auanema sp. JU1783]